MDPERFKSLARRHQLPTTFVPIGVHRNNEAIRDEIQQRGWNRFSDFEATCIAVANALVREMGLANGVPNETAVKIVSCNGGAIHEALRSIKPSPSAADIWLGYASHGDAGGANHYGDLATVTVKILSDLAQGERPARLILVNVSDVVRSMFERAHAAGIAFPQPEADADAD